MSTSDLPDLKELVNVSKLFSLLDDKGRLRLLGGATRRTAEVGEGVCSEGEQGDECYVVLGGKVSVQADEF